MIPYLGDFVEDDVVHLMFNTFSSDDPSASCTITNFINTDVHIHKDDNTTQRNNAAGITVSVNFDGITGSHMVKIDTSDNTVAGFWVTGHDYFVRIEGTTVDGATINAVVAHFSIENRFMRGTDSAALATTALTDATWTDAKAAFLDHSISTVDTVADGIQTDLSNATDGLGALKTLIDANQTDLDAILVDTGSIEGKVDTLDTVADGIQTDLSNATDGLGALKTLIDANQTDLDAILVDTGSIEGKIDTVDTVVDGIQTDLSNATDGLGALKTLIDACQTDLDNPAQYKATGFSTHDAADVKTAIEAVGSSIAGILADTGELQTDWVNGGRLDLLLDAILTDTSTTLDDKLNTILGLNQENFYIDNTAFTGANMTSCRIRIYSVAGSVGTASDVIATYNMTTTYAGDNLASYKVVKS